MEIWDIWVSKAKVFIMGRQQLDPRATGVYNAK